MSLSDHRAVLIAAALAVASLGISPAGAQTYTAGMQWSVRYNDPSNLWDRARSIALDDFGNVYVAGHSNRSESGIDYFAAKYAADDGAELWTAGYDATGSNDFASAVFVDGSKNVYVTGYSYGSTSGFDYATVKYDPNGVTAWAKRYEGPGYYYDDAVALVVDANANVYVTGNSPGNGTLNDYATIKYNTGGVEQWVRRYDGPTSDYDYGRALALDSEGNVYVTGYSNSDLATGVDIVTIKYNPAGVEQWVRHYDGPAHGDDAGFGIAIDSNDNVYVAGHSVGIGTDRDYVLIKYDTDGVEQWARRYDGPARGADYYEGLAVDGAGNAIVTGYSQGIGTDKDYATVKYDCDGNMQWVRRYDGPTGSYDRARGVAVDPTGNVYVTGQSTGFGGTTDYLTLKYDAAGTRIWVVRYNGEADLADEALAIIADTTGAVYVTGSSVGDGTNEDIVTIKYTQRLAGDMEPDGDVDLADVTAMVSAMGDPNQSTNGGVGDLDGDGDCDLADFTIMAGNVTGS